MSSIADIAQRLVAALRENAPPPAELYADPVRVLHDPPVPSFDGDMPLADFLRHMAQERAALATAMPDFRYDAMTLTEGESGFSLAFILRGGSETAEPLHLPGRLDYLCAHGRITQITAWLDPTRVETLVAILSPAVSVSA